MDKNIALLYILILAISFCLFFYLLTKTNFEKIFKKGQINEIRIGYFLLSFILSSLFSSGIVALVNNVVELILK